MATARRAMVAAAVLVAGAALTLLDAVVDHGRLVGGPVPIVVTGVAALAVGARCRPLVAAGVGLTGAVLLTAANQVHAPGSYTAGNDLVFFSVLLAGPLALGAIWASRTAQLRELGRLTRVRLGQRDVELELARTQERNRVAAAIHHGLVQQLGGIVIRAEGAELLHEAVAGRAALAEIEACAREALDELRTHVGLLRQPATAAAESSAAPPPRRTPAPELRPLDVAGLACAVPLAVECVAGGSAHGPALLNVLGAFVVCAPLIWRRPHPVAASCAVILAGSVFSALLTPLPETVTVLLPFLLIAFAVGAHTQGRRDLAVGCVVLVAGIVLLGLASPAGTVDDGSLAPTLFWAALGVIGGRISRGRQDRVARTAALLAEIDRGREAAIGLAVAERRQELARELHDSVAHAMTVVCLHATAGQRAPDDAASAVTEALAVVEEAARRGLGELRAGLDELETDHLPAEDVAAVVASARRAGLRVTTSGTDLDDGDPVAARVVREALVNVTRHSPGSDVSVSLSTEDGMLVVRVVNGGVPAPARSPADLGTGHGLALLAERVTAVDGRLAHGRTDDGGFVVTASLPRVARSGVPA